MNSNVHQKNLSYYLFFPIPFIFYWYTCLPSIGLGDAALFVYDIKHLRLATQVNTHNMSIIWGWVCQFLPIGDYAYRANLSCVFAGSIAICIFYSCIYSLHRNWLTALIASTFLMISHSMWWHSSYSEVYAINAILTTTVLYLYVQLQKTNSTKYLYWLFFVSGLAIFQHAVLGCFLVGTFAALGWRILTSKEKIWPMLWKSTLFLLIGLIPWLLTFAHDISLSHSAAQTIREALGGQFSKLFFKGTLLNGIQDNLFLIFMQFPSLYLLFVATGLFFFFKSWKLSASSVGMIVSFLIISSFYAFFNIWDKFAHILPTFIILAFCSSFAVHWIVNHSWVRKYALLRILLGACVVLSILWNFYFYAHLSRWGENPASMWHAKYNNTYYYNLYRSNEFLANPNKRNFREIENLCNLILDKLPPSAEYWDDDSRLYYTLWGYYQQLYHKRLDINYNLINSWGFQNWGADKSYFAQRIRRAYLGNKDFFVSSLNWPVASYLSQLPDKKYYQFKEFKLNDRFWIYKLITANESRPQEQNRWDKWDVLPIDKPIVIDLTMDNIINSSGNETMFQENMNSFGNNWKNNDQVFFNAAQPNAKIEFLLRFADALEGKMDLKFTTANDYGLIEISLNNILLTKEPIDLFTPNVYFKKIEFEHVVFEKGNNILSFRIVGKHNQSASMKIGVDTIEITPNSAR